MNISALQKARAAYQPKLPQGLRSNVEIKEGASTQSVDNQEEIQKLPILTVCLLWSLFRQRQRKNTLR